jgi:hypothetical protein
MTTAGESSAPYLARRMATSIRALGVHNLVLAVAARQAGVGKEKETAEPLPAVGSAASPAQRDDVTGQFSGSFWTPLSCAAASSSQSSALNEGPADGWHSLTASGRG